MKIVYDQAKEVVNQAKHGVSLGLAAQMEWETLWVYPDTRRDYGETRFIGFAYIGLRLFCVIFTDREAETETLRRIISLRKANPREIKRYAEA